MAKYRAQILLEPEQHAVLARLADARGDSISGVVREIVGEYLQEVRDEELEAHKRLALDGLTMLRKKIEGSHGTLAVDWLEEVREERSREMDERMGKD